MPAVALVRRLVSVWLHPLCRRPHFCKGMADVILIPQRLPPICRAPDPPGIVERFGSESKKEAPPRFWLFPGPGSAGVGQNEALAFSAITWYGLAPAPGDIPWNGI